MCNVESEMQERDGLVINMCVTEGLSARIMSEQAMEIFEILTEIRMMERDTTAKGKSIRKKEGS